MASTIGNLCIKARFDEARAWCATVPDEPTRAHALRLVNTCDMHYSMAFSAATKIFELSKRLERETAARQSSSSSSTTFVPVETPEPLRPLTPEEVEMELDDIKTAEETAFIDQHLKVNDCDEHDTEACKKRDANVYRDASILVGPRADIEMKLKSLTTDRDDALVDRFLKPEDEVASGIENISLERSDTSPPVPQVAANSGGPMRRISGRSRTKTSYVDPPNFRFKKDIPFTPRSRSAPPVPPRKKLGFLPVAMHAHTFQ